MALIAVAADKGAPGVTTTATALAAVWPRPVVLAECDPGGGDIVYRLPSAHGGRLDPRRGLLSLAVAARRGLEPGQVWEHAQRLRGGLDVLAGVTNAEQGSGIEPLWGPVGQLLAGLPGADVIADCGRLGPDGPYYELLAQAALVVLIIRPYLGEVVRLRDRAAAVALAAGRRSGREVRIGVLVIAGRRGYRRALAEVRHAVGGASSPVGLVAGIAHEPRSAQRLRGEWGGRLDRSQLIRTARDAAAQLAGDSLPSARPANGRLVHAGPPGLGLASTGPPGAGLASAGQASAGLARTGPPGAGPLPGVRPADAGRETGPRPAGAARSAGPAGPPRPARTGRHGPGAAAGTEETRAWAPGTPEPATRANGRPAAAAATGLRTGTWGSTGSVPGDGERTGSWGRTGAVPGHQAVPAAGPRAWGEQHLAHHPEADRPRPPWPDPAWPGSLPGRPANGQPVAGYPAPDGLNAARVTAARTAADQLAAAALTAAQLAAARLSPAQAAGARRGVRRGPGRGAGRGAGRGRHAAPPAQPAAGQDAAEPSPGRARPRGW